MKTSVLLVCFLGFVLLAFGDDCLDNSQAFRVANRILAFPLTQPNSKATMEEAIRIQAAAVMSSQSPYTIGSGVGYDNDDFYAVEACNEPGLACAYLESQYVAKIVNFGYYSDFNGRYWAIGADFQIDLDNPQFIEGVQYRATQRPWFTTTGWTDYYPFANLPVSGQSYTAQKNGAHLYTDRLSNEPCNACLTRSPLSRATTFVSSSDSLDGWLGLNSLNQVGAVHMTLLHYLMEFQQGGAIALLGVGFSNGDYYAVTDCHNVPNAAQIPECANHRFYGDFVNVRTNGNNMMHVVALDMDGDWAGSPRSEGFSYDPRLRPWYILGNGWTEEYQYAGMNSLFARSHAASFASGVVLADVNPEHLCPDWPAPCMTCPVPPAPGCGCAGKPGCGCGGDTNINFDFGHMLAH